jgi:hypothetical protein
MDIKIKTSSKVFTNRNINKLEKQGQEEWLRIAYEMGTDFDKTLIRAMRVPLTVCEKNVLELITGKCSYILDNSK